MKTHLIKARQRLIDRGRLLFEAAGPDAGTQLMLALSYEKANEPLRRPLCDYGFSCYSQTDEDGILLYLFAILGTVNRRCVEICAGNGLECNTANLLLNHGWHGLLVDGAADRVQRGRRFYSASRRTYVYPPTFVDTWITRDNVNEIMVSQGFGGEIDLLSLDLDGVDYWIWKALTACSPRVVVLEYQDILGPERSWTVPYSDSFSGAEFGLTGPMPNFAGASLSAFIKLGREKGYRFVGVNRLGFNAFFVREDLGRDVLPEVPVEAGFVHAKNQQGMRDRFPIVAELPWEEV